MWSTMSNVHSSHCVRAGGMGIAGGKTAFGAATPKDHDPGTAAWGKTMIAAPVTIVLIEDDPGHARLIEKNVRRAGFNNLIQHFQDGTSAIAALFDSPPAQQAILVLLDLNLPDMSGLDILARLKRDEHLRRAPVVVLTTTDDMQEIQRCYDLGCNVYITKPVEYESFATAIRQLGLFLSVMQVPEAS
jgi:CheY-like chemotaxis protein